MLNHQASVLMENHRNPLSLFVCRLQIYQQCCVVVSLCSPCAGEACTIVLRGATQQILDEAERSLHDALCVLSQTVKETRTVFGGGQYSSPRQRLSDRCLLGRALTPVCLCFRML